MRNEIYWLVTCEVKPGKFEEFTKVVEPLVAATKAEEGSLAYDYSVNDDQTLVHIFESYRDSTAVVDHVTKTFSQFADAFGACVDLTVFVTFGAPDAAAKEILDGFGSTYFTPFEGFTRK
ncbi:putative quinol monooxygenase [Subtercola frigoramans]|uniref:Quinol monooxygenase YgiN n=1 Tax=Subtercola frigoramans TaxID=120298 RepID=A0ABS2L167_9MICO|nr:antibiotic biosynthesis monooxygenase [Subtercola frigoramans]MBM7470802.1 quinol monooxygenase YgiN [Subtercola frigoramans]